MNKARKSGTIGLTATMTKAKNYPICRRLAKSSPTCVSELLWYTAAKHFRVNRLVEVVLPAKIKGKRIHLGSIPSRFFHLNFVLCLQIFKGSEMTRGSSKDFLLMTIKGNYSFHGSCEGKVTVKQRATSFLSLSLSFSVVRQFLSFSLVFVSVDYLG
jgi:hypothetical protein